MNIFGLLFIASYLLLIFALLRGKNVAVVLLCTSIFWCILGTVYSSGFDLALIGNTVFSDLLGGVLNSKAVAYMTILMGSWFAQILIKSNVVSTIIRTAVELGGDRPKLVVVLVMMVANLLFTSLYGIGPVIAVGVIVLPIFLSLGIDKRVATVAYASCVGVGTFLNISQYEVLRNLVGNFSTSEFPAFGAPWLPFGIYAFIIAAAINIIGVLLAMKFVGKKAPKKVHSWAAQAESASEGAPWYACITPFIPVILVTFFNLNILISFVIASLYCLLVTKTRRPDLKIYNTIVETMSDGMSAAGGMVVFMFAAFSMASGAQYVTPIIASSFGGILPTTTFALAALLAIGVPLLLYRGPLIIGGAGMAVYSTIAAIGIVSNQFVCLVAMLSSAIHYSLDPTSSPVVWACSYTKTDTRDYLKIFLPITWVWGIAVCMLLYFMHG